MIKFGDFKNLASDGVQSRILEDRGVLWIEETYPSIHTPTRRANEPQKDGIPILR